MRKIKENNILKEIYKKGRLVRTSQFLLGLLIISIAFNLFILPSGIVYGISGVGVILNKLYGIDPSLIILIGSILLLILSFITLGYEKTKNSILGSLLYPIVVKLTAYLPNYINIGDADPLVIALFGAVLSGFGLGLIFKAGYTTGGTDILNQIVAKYAKISIGNSMFFTDGIIILCGVFVFGWTKLMYSLTSLYIISVMTDKVILGISQSKAFYIVTNKEKEVKDFVMTELKHGVTELRGTGGFTGKNQAVLMCIVPTNEYYIFKEGIHKIDNKAFFVVTDAYEVYGGE